MSAAPVRRAGRAESQRRRLSGPAATRARPAGESRDTARRRAAAERRRRQSHFARRRRDLIEDAGVALVVAIVLISVTAGLGVLALLMILLAGLIAGSVLAPRIAARRRVALGRRGTGRRGSSGERADSRRRRR